VLAVRFSITIIIPRPCGGWRDRERLGEVFKRRAEKQHVFPTKQGDESRPLISSSRSEKSALRFFFTSSIACPGGYLHFAPGRGWLTGGFGHPEGAGRNPWPPKAS
jgi:hypothetical protein